MSLAAPSVPVSRGAELPHQHQVTHVGTPEKKPMRRISGVRGEGKLISMGVGVL